MSTLGLAYEHRLGRNGPIICEIASGAACSVEGAKSRLLTKCIVYIQLSRRTYNIQKVTQHGLASEEKMFVSRACEAVFLKGKRFQVPYFKLVFCHKSDWFVSALFVKEWVLLFLSHFFKSQRSKAYHSSAIRIINIIAHYTATTIISGRVEHAVLSSSPELCHDISTSHTSAHYNRRPGWCL